MAITINGSGTIAGISAGGLPLGAGGKFAQVVHVAKKDTFSTTASDGVFATVFSAQITPSSTSSKILVMWNSEVSTSSDGQRMAFRMLRGSTAVNVADASGNKTRSDIGNLNSKNGASIHPASATFLDSPSTTSQLTYNLQVGAETGGNTLFVNKAAGEVDSDSYYRSTSNIVLIEVAA